MDTFWFVILASLLALGSIWVGFSRNRRFRRKENLHRELGRRHGLRLAYQSERDLTLFGTYRGYPLRIEAVPVRLNGEVVTTALQCSLPMVNPTRKALRIAKRSPALPAWDQVAVIDRPIHFRHDLGDWLEIQTNDFLFASRILSDNVKISLFEAFKPLEGAVLYVEDAALAFLSPQLMTTPEAQAQVQKAIDLLADMKDELN